MDDDARKEISGALDNIAAVATRSTVKLVDEAIGVLLGVIALSDVEGVELCVRSDGRVDIRAIRNGFTAWVEAADMAKGSALPRPSEALLCRIGPMRYLDTSR